MVLKRRKKTISPERREAAVGRILRSESTEGDEAAKLHVKASAVKAWVTMARNGTSPGRPRSTDRGESGPRGASSSDGDSSPRLERALHSAIGGPSDDDEDEQSSIPPPGPEQVLAFTETMRGMGLRFYAGFLGIPEDDVRLERVLRFNEADRATLGMWAPYAAEYVPALIGHSKEVGAWIYLGTAMMGTLGALAEVNRIAKANAARRADEPWPRAGDPGGQPESPGM